MEDKEGNTKGFRGYDVLDNEEEDSRESKESANSSVEEKGETTAGNQKEEGQVWELPSPPNEDEDSYEKSEEEDDYEDNDDTHIKVRLKQRVQKGKPVDYFSGLLMV